MQRVGIRGVLNRSTRDISTPQAPIPNALIEDTDTAVRQGEALVKRWNEDAEDRIRAWFSLRYVYNVGDDLARRIKQLADTYQVGIHAHCAAVKDENELVQAIFGMRSVERYHRLGLLGPNLCLIHMGWVNDAEIELLYEHGVKIVHCPSASMHGAYGNVANRMFPRMIERGLTVGLGTDSATAGRFLDMVRVMYLAACAHKDVYADARVMGAYKALEMATIDGARVVLWEDQIGSLEIGKRADVVLVDMRGFQWHPMRDPVANLIYSANGESVETVIIDGRIVMRERRLLTIDADEVRAEVRRAADEVARRAGIEVKPPWPVL
jgi:5-methylthioadenosine/S-adenosylhomocysteine deaminase